MFSGKEWSLFFYEARKSLPVDCPSPEDTKHRVNSSAPGILLTWDKTPFTLQVVKKKRSSSIKRSPSVNDGIEEATKEEDLQVTFKPFVPPPPADHRMKEGHLCLRTACKRSTGDGSGVEDMIQIFKQEVNYGVWQSRGAFNVQVSGGE